MKRGSVFRWGIEKKGTGQLIGTCGFHLINHHHKRAEIGYELDDTNWGQGYASEALQAILAYGFEKLQLIRIAAVVYVENKASQKLLNKAGFQEEGLLRKHMIQNGVAHDTIFIFFIKRRVEEIMSTNELITIMKKHRENRFILGIDGLSRSGKTTFVANLKENMKQESIPFHIFHIDDHIVERNKRYDTGFEEWYEYYYLQWDIEWLRQKFFSKVTK